MRLTSHLPGGRLSATAERLVLEHRLMPLLRGAVVIERIVLERPFVELDGPLETSTARGGAPPPIAPPEVEPEIPPPSEDGGGPSLDTTHFQITDGTFIRRVGGELPEETVLRGLEVELRDIALARGAPSLLQGLSASGTIAAEEVTTPTTRASDVEGHLALDAGVLEIVDFIVPTPHGRLVVGELTADFNADPYTYRLRGQGDPLDTNLLLGAAAHGGFGPARLKLELAGSGSGEARGHGVLTIAAGELPVLPILAAIEQLFTNSPLIGAAYEALEVRFQIDGDRRLLGGDG